MKLLGKRKTLDNEKVRYEFRGDITIYTVKQLKDILFHELDEKKDIELDLAKIEKFDTAGLQLLLHINDEAKKSGRKIYLNQKSPDVDRLLNFFNISL